MRYIDNFLSKITMYRLVFQGLVCLAIVAVLRSLFGMLDYNFFDIIFTALVLTAVCNLSNRIFAKLFKIQTNYESVKVAEGSCGSRTSAV